MASKRAVCGAVLVLLCGLMTTEAADVRAEPPPQEHDADATEEHGPTSDHDPSTEAEGHATHEDHSGHHDRSHIKNEVALFLGATDEHGHDIEFSWGFDYKRKVSGRSAAGAFFDYAGGDLRNTVLGGLFFWWPFPEVPFQIFGGPGVEFHDGRNQDGDDSDEGNGHAFKSEGGGHDGTDANETYFLVRVGVGYDFHIGSSYGIVPTVMLDFVNGEEVWVYGLAFTYGW